MYEYIFFTQFTLVLITLLIMLCCLLIRDKQKINNTCSPFDGLLDPPQPRKLPLIGHLHLLAGYEIPFQAFNTLRKKFGDVIGLKLGNVESLVVCGHKNIREILITKGHHFDGRPSFERYNMMFSGNRDNSLAFCDWSDMHKLKRDTLKVHTFPRAYTSKFNSLEDIIKNEANSFVSQINSSGLTKLKPFLANTTANIFMKHFCSKSFDTNTEEFNNFTRNFDLIFHEINQGYAVDFLPFLMPLHTNRLDRLYSKCKEIRKFVVTHIIGDRVEMFSDEKEPEDYVDSIIKQIKCEDTSFDEALFALEDLLGGHCAITNFVLKALAFLVKEPDVQRKIQSEIDSVTGLGNETYRKTSISDRNHLPYIEATIFEAIRLVASAVVPRVANQDSSLCGYRIKKGTLIFLDNYEMSMSEELWDEPTHFRPERFLVDNQFVKPEHFLPFGGGRRGCMGYKMVQLIGFGMLSTLLQNFTVLPVSGENYKVPVGALSLPEDTYQFNFEKRLNINVI